MRLWTTGSLIETIRDLLRRAYGTQPARHFWHHRLASTGIVALAVIFLLVALLVQVVIGAAEEAISAWSPRLDRRARRLVFSRVAPAITIYLRSTCCLFRLPRRHIGARRYPKWPGSLFVAVWWVGVTMMFPALIRAMFTYDLTYGSLAGIMITLFFFWLIGLGMVAGAELNAALALSPREAGAQDAGANEQEEAA